MFSLKSLENIAFSAAATMPSMGCFIYHNFYDFISLLSSSIECIVASCNPWVNGKNKLFLIQ